MMTYILLAAGIVLCVCLSAYCSSSEMAYSSCNTIRLENLRDDEGNRRAAVAFRITERFDDALGAILISNNLANIAASSIGSVLTIMAIGEGKAWVSTLVVTVLVIIFGETIPKITSKKNANAVALKHAYVVRVMMTVLKPLVWLSVTLVHLVTRGMKPAAQDEEEAADEAVEELQNIIETAEDEEVLDEERSELVQAAIDFADISASEVMTARVDICAIDVEDSWEDILAAVEQAPFSRIPVYEGSIDNIIGILYLNRFLKAITEGDRVNLRSFLMPPCYVYKTMKMPAVLSQLRKARQHLAVVSDEYGGTLGVVSMEDVLEQIVGDIWDESDTVEPEVVEKARGEYELDGDMTISDFLELMGIDEESFEAESETVGGWTVESFGMFPKVGYSFVYEGLEITVMRMSARRVEKVFVKVLPSEGEE